MKKIILISLFCLSFFMNSYASESVFTTFVSRDADADMKETFSGGWWKGSADVEEDSSFGGYVGAAIPLAEKTDMTFEVTAISGGWHGRYF
jgi:hypothetical protein